MSAFADSLPELSVLRRCWPDYRETSKTHRFMVHGVELGRPRPVIIAGPCAVESFEQTLATGQAVRQAGGELLRGGVFKPRSSPHSFQGLGAEGLEILAEVRRQTGLGVVTEVMDPGLVELASEFADMIQIGSRSMQSFPLLREVGKTRTPVLLKRGWSATLEEWLCAAEYIASEGNRNIALCERGIRTSCQSPYARNLLDLNVIEPTREATPLPLIVDPSHSTGRWQWVEAMSRGALAVGAHGLLVEALGPGIDREGLRCDAEQGVPPEVLARIVKAAATFGEPMLA
ncbi:MAG: 3-deoxy-7-phosphoheptulonate synthase [Thermoanaerobaculia bacterium]